MGALFASIVICFDRVDKGTNRLLRSSNSGSLVRQMRQIFCCIVELVEAGSRGNATLKCENRGGASVISEPKTSTLHLKC